MIRTFKQYYLMNNKWTIPFTHLAGYSHEHEKSIKI
jgi:hypothetical protein